MPINFVKISDMNLLLFSQKIFWDYTSTKVLTMEYIRGVKPDSSVNLYKQNIDGSKIAVKGLHAILKNVICRWFLPW